ncbi:MAG: biopolymer transporter ExbD [Nonlabens sp.]|jgi:biopolymer transport protein ExbD|uniref:ExbD/TolR family protein n=1 Tax=Nonlabens sp. TaxID=1888209 RepID=UPI0035A5F278
MARRSAPEVNAGSMADIAFLLLIFFLVTTTIEVDSGIASKLPPPLEDVDPPPIKVKNLFQVVVNSENRLLVEDADMDISKLTEAAVKFLDNGGGTDPRNACSYCRGDKDPESSDNPKKAIISLVNDRQTSYKMYLAVTNELIRAYAILRDRESKRLYNETYESMMNRLNNWPATETDTPEYEELEDRIDKVMDLFPRNLSEAEPQKR